MNAEQIVVTLVVGGVAGWLAGLIMKKGFGLIGSIIVGVVGALVGGFLLQATGLSLGGGLAGALVTAVLGAVVLILLVGLIKK